MSRLTTVLLAIAACGREPVNDSTDTGLPPVTDSDTTTSPAPIDVSACLAGPDQPGPWAQHPIARAGATVTTDPPAEDAGLADVVAAGTGAISPLVVDPPIAVAGAVVTSVDYVPTVNDGTGSFWLEDAQAAITTYRLTTTPSIDPAELAPGAVVSFEVTEVQDFFGVIEVTGAQNFTVIGSAPVPVVDGNDGLDLSTDLMRTVELWGGLASEPEPCGGESVCFDYVYPGGTAVYRTESVYDRAGDCIHYIGPLGVISGEPQVDVRNFDWYEYF